MPSTHQRWHRVAYLEFPIKVDTLLFIKLSVDAKNRKPFIASVCRLLVKRHVPGLQCPGGRLATEIDGASASRDLTM